MRTWITFALLAACGGRSRLDVPDQLRGKAAYTQPPYAVKLTDNDRTWQVWLPPVSGGYEVRIPIGKGDALAGTQTKRAGILSQDSTEFRAAMARVQGLFQRKSYELALLELGKLREDFPDDPKLLSMQGTLYLAMGDKQKAQESWERVLELDPTNATVLEKLEAIK